MKPIVRAWRDSRCIGAARRGEGVGTAVKEYLLPRLRGLLHGIADDESVSGEMVTWWGDDPRGNGVRLQQTWKAMLSEGRWWNMVVNVHGLGVLALIPAGLQASHFLQLDAGRAHWVLKILQQM